MFTLVPVNFFNPATAYDALAEVARIKDGARVKYREIPQYGAVLIYDISGEESDPPGIFHILSVLPECREYNKLVCSWKDGALDLAIAQGRSLLLANSYPAADFVTALYFILFAMKSLQLNPEVTTICFRNPLGSDDEMTLYRYFKAVERI